MKEVKTLQKYKCDFCKMRSTKARMEIHEKRCFRNPNRFCDFCSNTGEIIEHEDNIGKLSHPCPYCSSFDGEKLRQIEAREKGESSPTSNIEDEEIPF